MFKICLPESGSGATLIYTFEEFELDGELYELRRNGVRVAVEPQVFDVILYLVAHRDRVVSKQELFESIWKTRFVTESALTSRIKAARRALGDAGREQRLIGTVHGRGYRFLGAAIEKDSSTSTEGTARRPQHLRAPGTFVGRKHELDRLHELFAAALGGSRRTVVVTGEAGIGKTSTIRAFLDDALSSSPAIMATGQCLEHQGPSEPYMPLFNAIDGLCRSHPELKLLNTVARSAPSWLMEMPWLLDDDELAALAQRTVGTTRFRMLREIVEACLAISEIRPLILVLEDLQWSDPSTLDCLNALGSSPVDARLLIVGSCRTADLADPVKPVAALLHGMQLRGLAEEIELPRLTEEETGEYVSARLAGRAVPAGAGRLLHSRTDGNPLFMELLVNELSASRDPLQTGLPAGEQAARVPASLGRIVEQRLAKLSRREQEVLEAAAVAGIDTSPVLIARVLGASEEAVEEVCDRLARTGQFLRRHDSPAGSSISPGFAFAHSVHQEVVYDRMPSARRARLHGAVARALEASYGSRVAERAGEVAFHFSRAREASPAVAYLQMAAGQALKRFAYREAMSLIDNALGLAEELEPEARLPSEIALLHMRALAIVMLKGWSDPEVEQLLKKAITLSQPFNDPDSLSLLLYHLAAVYENCGEHEKSKEVLQRRLSLHPHFADPTSLLESHELLACSLFHKGEFSRSLEHADQGWSLYDPERHLALLAATVGENLGICCQSWAALDLWYLGNRGGAKQRMKAALDLAGEPAHSYCLARTEERAAMVHQLLGETEQVLEHSERAIDLGIRQGLEVGVATARILRGWARATLGELEDGRAELLAGLESFEATGSRIGLPYFLALLAEASLLAKDPADALAATDRGLEIVGDHGYSHEAELHRLRGLAVAQLGREDEALLSFQRAVDVARSQGARSLELRALETLAAHGTPMPSPSVLQDRLEETPSPLV